jgi:cell division protein FtsQ
VPSFWRRLETYADRLARVGAISACGFIMLSAAYACVLGGQAARVFDSAQREASAMLVAAGFGIRDAVIEGAENLSREQIEWALFEGDAQTMFGFDARLARQRLAELGWVQNAEVWRFWPSTIVVHIEERKALARWRIGGREVLIDSSGEPLGPVTSSFDALPVVAGIGANTEAATLMHMLDTAGMAHQVSAAERVASRRWDLLLVSGMRVKLPANLSDSTLELVSAVLAKLGDDRQPISVDFRIPGRIALDHGERLAGVM